MKIVICGSTAFGEEKIEIRDKLKLLGHEPVIDVWTEKIVKGDKELKKAVERKKSTLR